MTPPSAITGELENGERQVAPTLDGIRADHRSRYEWVAERVTGKLVVDAACGVGYGSKILADKGCRVRAYDRNPEAIAYAQEHYAARDAEYVVGDLYDVAYPTHADAVVCFEALEHVKQPGRVLQRFRTMAPRLYVSVPNESDFPFMGWKFHERHYRKAELEELLLGNGWLVKEWWGQADTEAAPTPGASGRTLIAVCERMGAFYDLPDPEADTDPVRAKHIINGKAPHSVAIIAMGESKGAYLTHAAAVGDRRLMVDETWTINAMASVIQADRIFHMDDLRIQEARADYKPNGPSQTVMVRGMLDAFKRATAPIYTSRAHPDYPNTRDFPLEWVANKTGQIYFNGTVPYAVAFAIALGVKRLYIFGCDYSYADNPHKREKGRACLEFWIGLATGKGMQVFVPTESQLIDACDTGPNARIYGYDTEWIEVEQAGGNYTIKRTERKPEEIPSAAEMERRYSHCPATEEQEGDT